MYSSFLYIAELFFSIAGLNFDVNISIFVSPIVFPLAFSINGESTNSTWRDKTVEMLTSFENGNNLPPPPNDSFANMPSPKAVM